MDLEFDSDEVEKCKTCNVASVLRSNRNLHCGIPSLTDDNAKELIITGKFVENRPNLLGPSYPIYLCLRDETGAIPCLITTSGPLVFEKQIMCLCWNYIKENSDKPGYIEINNWVIIKDDSSEDPTIDVVTALGAYWLLSNRKTIKLKLVNILGEVDIVTEVFMVHGDPVFIINLDGKIDVLIKGNKFLHWQQLMVPGKSYVFTNLRPTTLFKGKSNERPVYVPWKGSVVHQREFVPHKVLSLQEYCNSCGLNISDEEMVDCENISAGTSKLITYQGVVTNLLDAEMILDQKSKLTVAFVNAVHKYEHVRPDSEVVFHNVHVEKNKQSGEVNFVCCLRSCIKIEKFPSHFLPGKVYDCEKNPLWSLMNNFSLNFPELKLLAWNYEKLQQKISPTFSKSACEETMKIMLDNYELDNRRARVFLDEVLAPGHRECAIAAERKGISWNIPCVNDIERSTDHRTETKEKDWSFSVVDNSCQKKPQVLIGWLNGNPVTGQLEFCDQSRRLPCVISRHHSDALHQCSLSDCKVPYNSFSLSPAIHCCCPYPQTWWMGVLVMVKDFHLVRETFGQGTHSGTKTSTYLLFSLLDVTVISTEKTSLSKLVKLRNPEMPIDVPGTLAGPPATSSEPQFVTSQLILVIHKDNLVVRSRTNDEARLHFYIQACFIGSPSVYESGKDELKHLDSEENEDANGRNLSVRFVALVFTGKNVRWYHLVHPECVYRLMHLNSNDVNAFKATVKSRPLQRVLDKHAIEECLTMRDDALLVRVGESCTTGDVAVAPIIRKVHTLSKKERDWVHEARHDMWKSSHIPEINTVQEILQKRQQSFSNELPLLSCEGLVKKRLFFSNNRIVRSARHARQNEMLGISVPGDPCLKLFLADPDTGDTLEIIAQMTDMSYPLAVIPGTKVRLTKLEQKPAAANFHCRVTVASNIAVTVFSDFASSNDLKSTVQDYNLSKLLSVYLIDLMGQTCDASLKLCDCLISKIFQLHLQLVCVGCSMSANDWHLAQECTTCGTCQMPRVKAYAVAQVDDGTHSARVSCVGGVVPQLLSLTAPQWNDLQQLVQSVGSVEYSPYSLVRGERPVDKFIENLCQSDHVCRPVSLVAHRKFYNDSQNACSKRTIKVAGRTLETYCLPIMHLEAVAFLPQDLRKVTNRLLSDH